MDERSQIRLHIQYVLTQKRRVLSRRSLQNYSNLALEFILDIERDWFAFLDDHFVLNEEYRSDIIQRWQTIINEKRSAGSAKTYLKNTIGIINTYFLQTAPFLRLGRGRNAMPSNRYSQIALTIQHIQQLLELPFFQFQRNIPLTHRVNLAFEYLLYFLMISTSRRHADIINLSNEEVSQLLEGKTIHTLCVKTQVFQIYKIRKDYLDGVVEISVANRTPIHHAKNLWQWLNDSLEVIVWPSKKYHNFFSIKCKKRLAVITQSNNDITTLRLGQRNNQPTTMYGNSLHELRRFAITNTIEYLARQNIPEEVALQTVSLFAGHSTPRTTQRYIRNNQIVNTFNTIL